MHFAWAVAMVVVLSVLTVEVEAVLVTTVMTVAAGIVVVMTTAEVEVIRMLGMSTLS